MKSKDKDLSFLAWKMFEKTGSLSYYMLYKHANDKEKDDKKF